MNRYISPRLCPPCLCPSGYYARFFQETRLLGSGSFGAVYLCRHVLDDMMLGDYAAPWKPWGLEVLERFHTVTWQWTMNQFEDSDVSFPKMGSFYKECQHVAWGRLRITYHYLPKKYNDIYSCPWLLSRQLSIGCSCTQQGWEVPAKIHFLWKHFIRSHVL